MSILKGGQVVDRMVGLMPKAQIVTALKRHIDQGADRQSA